MASLTVKEDPDSGDLYLEFPDDLMNELGWEIGDNLKWTENKDGSWSLEKMNAPAVDQTERISE